MTWDSIEHAYLQAKELDAPFDLQHFLSNKKKQATLSSCWTRENTGYLEELIYLESEPTLQPSKNICKSFVIFDVSWWKTANIKHRRDRDFYLYERIS